MDRHTHAGVFGVVTEAAATPQVRSEGQQAGNKHFVSGRGDYHVLGLVHIPKNCTHTHMHHPQQLAASWHKEAMKNLVQVHLGGPRHIKIQSSGSCVAGQVPPGSVTGARDPEASCSCRGPFSSFVPPIFSLPLPNLLSSETATELTKKSTAKLRKSSSAAASTILIPPTPSVF